MNPIFRISRESGIVKASGEEGVMADTRARRCKQSPAPNREQGRQHVEAQAERGSTVQDDCLAYGLKTHTFRNWRRRFTRGREAPSSEGSNRAYPAIRPLLKCFSARSSRGRKEVQG